MKLLKSLWRQKNDQILKEVRPQEVNLLVQTPRNDEPASGSRLRECIQNFETMEKEIQFSRIWENATFFHRVSFWNATVADVQDGFGDRTPACRGFSHPRADSNSRIYAHEVRNTATLEDEKYRNSRQPHGWTEEYCRYLDYLDDRHLPHRTLAPQAPVRERHHIGMQ